ncbi:hypothetical protein B0I12_001952 [Microbacterium hydrothermale]|nr:hypothetical protein [Microbacterium hydrothermale]
MASDIRPRPPGQAFSSHGERANVLAAAITDGDDIERADAGTWLTRDDDNGYTEPGFLVGDDAVVVAPSGEHETDIVWVNGRG